MDQQHSNLIGRQYAGYEIEGLVATSTDGGLVTRAVKVPREDPPLQVALTVVNPTPLPQAIREGLKRRWAIARTLSHPSLVRVLDYGRKSDLLYVATEWLDGPSLSTYTRSCSEAGELPTWQASASVGIAVAEALDYLHQWSSKGSEGAHLAHGRVWPARVLLMRSGHVKLLGFAGPGERMDQIMLREPSLACLACMAPEQIDGNRATPRSDVYGVALLVLSMATGSNPVLRETAEATRAAIRTGEGIESALEALHADAAAALRTCLALKPEDRPASIAWLARNLEQSVRTEGVMQPSEWRAILADLPKQSAEPTEALLRQADELAALLDEFVGELAMPADGLGGWDGADESWEVTTAGSPDRLVGPENRSEDDAPTDGEIERHPSATPPRRADPVETRPRAEPEPRTGRSLAPLLVLLAAVPALLVGVGAWVFWPRDEPTEAVVEVSPDPARLRAEEHLAQAADAFDRGELKLAKDELEASRDAVPASPELDPRRDRLQAQIDRGMALARTRLDIDGGELDRARVRVGALLDANPTDEQAIALLTEIRRIEQAAEEAEEQTTDQGGPRPAAPSRGLLTVSTSPAAVIYLDGVVLGPSPIAGHKLPIGRHELEARVAGHESARQTVEIQNSKETALQLTLRPAGASDIAAVAPPTPAPAPTPAPQPEDDDAVAEAVVPAPAPTPTPSPAPAPASYDGSVGSALPLKYEVRDVPQIRTAFAAVEAHLRKANVSAELYRGVTDALASEIERTHIASAQLEIYPRPVFEAALASFAAGRSTQETATLLVQAHKQGDLRKASRGR